MHTTTRPTLIVGVPRLRVGHGIKFREFNSGLQAEGSIPLLCTCNRHPSIEEHVFYKGTPQSQPLKASLVCQRHPQHLCTGCLCPRQLCKVIFETGSSVKDSMAREIPLWKHSPMLNQWLISLGAQSWPSFASLPQESHSECLSQ